MLTKVTKAALHKKISIVARVERVNKRLIGELSREMLDYLVTQDTGDKDTLNRLIAVLTPKNQDAMIKFMRHFITYKYNEDNGLFEGKIKNKKRKAEKDQLVAEFLAEPENNVWTWEGNKGNRADPKSFEERITELCTNALNGTKKTEKISVEAILGAVLAVDGIGVEHMVPLVEAIVEQEKEELPKAA